MNTVQGHDGSRLVMSRDMKLAALSVAIGATLAVAVAIIAYYVMRVTP